MRFRWPLGAKKKAWWGRWDLNLAVKNGGELVGRGGREEQCRQERLHSRENNLEFTWEEVWASGLGRAVRAGWSRGG